MCQPMRTMGRSTRSKSYKRYVSSSEGCSAVPASPLDPPWISGQCSAVHTASARTLLTSDHGQNCPATRIKHDKHRFYGETIYKYLNIAIQDNISEVQMFATGYYLIRIRSTSVPHYININYLDIISFFMQMKSTERE